MADSNAVLLAQINKGGTIGVGYLGVVASSMVYGVTCIQTFQYYRSERAKTDGFWLHGIVRHLGAAGLSLEAAADFIVSAALIYYLYKGRTGMPRSDDMVARLILLTVATGCLTTCVAIANLVAYIAAPSSLYVLFFTFLISKIMSGLSDYIDCIR
ncbi:hypothetical protein BD309DRAFT_855387 [Dichomitus squalens]|nr:hypothetical protein BD309DRAFT_855387 [Dichomitus squalens]